jgi:hypothetical protein
MGFASIHAQNVRYKIIFLRGPREMVSRTRTVFWQNADFECLDYAVRADA